MNAREIILHMGMFGQGQIIVNKYGLKNKSAQNHVGGSRFFLVNHLGKWTIK